MSEFSPALDAALSADRAIVFAAIDIDTPDREVRLLVNGGFVIVPQSGVLLGESGEPLLGEDGTPLLAEPSLYKSRDDVFGVFSDIDTIADGVGDEAPSVTVTLIPESNADLAQVAASSMQGSAVRIWLGAVDPVTGLCIDRYLLLDGILDVATIRIDETGNRKVDYDVGSIFDEFFLANDMARLSSAFHRYLWPGEAGCDSVTWVTHQLYFGTEAPDGVSR